MSNLLDEIPDHIDRYIVTLVMLTIIFVVFLLWSFERTRFSNIIAGIGVIVSFIAIIVNRYNSNQQGKWLRRQNDQLDEQIDELRKRRLQPQYDERVEIINNAIDSIETNLEHLEKGDVTYDFERILDLSEINPQHKDYFESHFSELAGELERQSSLESELRSSYETVQDEIRFYAERYMKEKADSESRPTGWLIDQILTFSRPSPKEVREKFGVSSRNDTDIQFEIIETHHNTKKPGIFAPFDKPDNIVSKPSWMNNYIETRQDLIDYYKRIKGTLEAIRQEQTNQ